MTEPDNDGYIEIPDEWARYVNEAGAPWPPPRKRRSFRQWLRDLREDWLR